MFWKNYKTKSGAVEGFTLIELLVVIAIIGVISSIVLVNLSGTREKATVAKGLQFSQSIYHGLGAYAVGVWDFENNLKDRSGYNNNCTPYAALSYVDSVSPFVGKAVDLGTYNWLNCGNNKVITSPQITMEAWAKASTLDNNRGIITNKSDFQYGINIFMESHYIGSGIGGGGVMSVIFTDWEPSKDVWYHIAITHDAQNNNSLYVNGKLEKSLNKVIAYSANNYIGIGCFYKPDNTTCIGNFKGVIDGVRIYETSFTAAEIQKHYAEGLGNHKLVEK